MREPAKADPMGNPRPSLRGNAAWLVVIGLVGLGATGATWIAWRGNPAAAGPASRSESPPARPSPEGEDPVAMVRARPVMAQLIDEQPLRFDAAGNLADLKPGTNAKFFFTTVPQYDGSLTEDAAAKLVKAGLSSALEHRLTASASSELRTQLAEFDDTLRDLSILVADEENHIRSLLREKPGRSFSFRSAPAELDPAYPGFAGSRPLAAEGTIWREALEPGGERLLVVRWDEWPELLQLHKDQRAMVLDRLRRVTRWIDERYASGGLAIFDPATNQAPDATGRAR